jgi:hypothetical protein
MEINSLRQILQRDTKSLEDLKNIQTFVAVKQYITKEYNFMKNINNEELFFKICKSAKLKTFNSEENIFMSSIDKDNYIILKGNANMYKREKIESNHILV